MTKEGDVTMHIHNGRGLLIDVRKHRRVAQINGHNNLHLKLEQEDLEIIWRGDNPNSTKTISRLVAIKQDNQLSAQIDAPQLEKACNILFGCLWTSSGAHIRVTDNFVILSDKKNNMLVSLPRADRPRVPETDPDLGLALDPRTFYKALKRSSIARSKDEDSPYSDMFLEISKKHVILQATDQHRYTQSIVTPVDIPEKMDLYNLRIDSRQLLLAEALIRDKMSKDGKISLSVDPGNHQLILQDRARGISVRLPYNEFNLKFFQELISDVNKTDTITFNADDLRQRMGMFNVGKDNFLEIGSEEKDGQQLLTLTQSGYTAQGRGEANRVLLPYDISTSVPCTGMVVGRMVKVSYLKQLLKTCTTKDEELDLQISEGDSKATFRSQDGTFTCVMMTRNE